MPSYRYVCSCGWRVEKFFRTLPSEDKQIATPCEECGQTARRSFGDEGFFAVGGQHGGVEKAVGMAAQTDASGRPVFRDENGKVHEIRSSRDVDSFQKHNALGLPRMVEWRNPVTGEKTWTQQRTRMVSDPVTGEVDEAKSGAIVRGPERLTPLDGGDSWSPPSESVTGLPIVNGAIQPRAIDEKRRNEVWAQREGNEPEVREVGVRHPPPGKKWS